MFSARVYIQHLTDYHQQTADPSHVQDAVHRGMDTSVGSSLCNFCVLGIHTLVQSAQSGSTLDLITLDLITLDLTTRDLATLDLTILDLIASKVSNARCRGVCNGGYLADSGSKAAALDLGSH